jgi:hypothetical protein
MAQTNFNVIRALEGGIVAAVIAGGSAYQAIATNPGITEQAITTSVLVTFVCAFVKGFGQSFSPPASVQTTITQPAGTTAHTENVATAPVPPVEEAPHG